MKAGRSTSCRWTLTPADQAAIHHCPSTRRAVLPIGVLPACFCPKEIPCIVMAQAKHSVDQTGTNFAVREQMMSLLAPRVIAT